MEQKQRKGLVYGSLAADSLSLGSHWVYNVQAIEKRLGTPDKLTDPIVKSFHPTRKRGEFTHYGDQAFWLLEHIAQQGDYDSGSFFELWKQKMTDYDGYMDKASKATLEAGTASSSDDLGGAGRTAPLAYLYHDDSARLAEAAQEQATLTHADPLVADTARFFSLLLFETEQPMDQAIVRVLSYGGWKSENLLELVEAGVNSSQEETTPSIKQFGQMCSAQRALPAAVHLLVRYSQSYREAMIANTAAGGDSAARGLLVGMVLGARGGYEAIPSEWIEPLVYRERIEKALETIG
ncbi:MAG: ADP-ribosylglycohydrolase family protein [Spirochaetota bacterium]